MKYLIYGSVVIMMGFCLSCSSGKKDESKKPSILEIGKKLVETAQEAEKKASKKMDVEFAQSAEHAESHDHAAEKDITLTDTHFKVALDNMDANIKKMNGMLDSVRKKAKDGEFSVMESLALLGEIAGSSLGADTDYMEQTFKGDELNEMKHAFRKIVSMTTAKQMGNDGLLQDFDYEKAMASLDVLKKSMESVTDESQKAAIQQQISEMEKQYTEMKDYSDNPLKNYPEGDVQLFKTYEDRLNEKTEMFKNIIKQLGDTLKSTRQ